MLEEIADSIRRNQNIIEKKEISPIVKYINDKTYKSSRIYSDLGEDSAAINDQDTYILVTTDRINTNYIKTYPYGAGFSSILVGVDDIFCCGGRPLAASLILSYKDPKIGQEIIEGICEGSTKFQVPIIRGHTKPRSESYELSSTMVGEILKQDYISATNAQIGDAIILAVDFDGKVAKANKLYWDTVTFKSSDQVLKKRKAMNQIAHTHIIHASKDISNGGIFGSILQIVKYSSMGANIDINSISIPPKLKEKNYSLEQYSKMYLTTSYVLTAPLENCDEAINIFNFYGLDAMIIGKIIKEPILKIHDKKSSIEVIKY
jgi:selenophosphate synthetase-related protein